jgi:predicted transcriptional regulator
MSEIKKEEVKKEDPKPTTSTPITSSTTPQIQSPPATTSTQDVIDPSAKILMETAKKIETLETKVKELETMATTKTKELTDANDAIKRLQESAKASDEEKRKAVEAATKEAKEAMIKKVEECLPPAHITSQFNRGGQNLATAIRKVIYETKEEPKKKSNLIEPKEM